MDQTQPAQSAQPSAQAVKPGTSNHAPRIAGILEMARRMIAGGGIEALNMRDLAAATESSLRTLYTRFGSKDALLAMVVADTFESVIDARILAQPASTTGVANLVQLMQYLQKISVENAAYTKTIMGLYYKHGIHREVAEILFGMMRDRIGTAIAPLIEPEKRAGRTFQLLQEEATDRVFSITMNWTLKLVPGHLLADRLIYSTLTCLRHEVAPAAIPEVDETIKAAFGRITT
jgi:AcrR family transcriptional regulator